MNFLLKKPYEISLWEDRIYYIYQQDGKIVESDSLPTSGAFNLLNEFTKEVKIGIIGSDSIDSPIKAINPILNKNLNGSRTFSFQMPYKYYSEENDEYKLNPFTNLLVNERKIKLKYDNEWYDFIIKDIEEDSLNYFFTYTATDLFINELSKNGYEIELDVELENNMGTIGELGSLVLEKTDWNIIGSNQKKVLNNGEVLQSEVIQQTKEEAVYQYILQTACVATDMRDKSHTIQIPSGSVIYISYSSISEAGEQIQFFYNSDGIVANSDGIITNSRNWEAQTPEDLWLKKDGKTKKGEIDKSKIFISYVYRGETLVKKQKTKYVSNINKYCTVYSKNNEEYYSYFKTIYTTPAAVQNLLTNNSNFITDSGWYGVNNCTVTPSYIKNALDDKVYSGLHLNFSTNGYISNDGIYSNRAIIDTFTEKERYYFVVKYLQLDKNNLKYPISGARIMSYFITKDQFRKEGKTYYTLDNNRSYIAISNNEDFKAGVVYFEGKEILKFESMSAAATVDKLKDLNGYVYSSAEVTQSFSLTELKESYDLVFEITGSGEGYIAEAKLFKELLDKNNKLIVPDLTKEFESIVKTQYYFFPKSLLEQANIESEEDLIYSDICTYEEIGVLGYTPVNSDNYEKVTSITASKSNCFNLIQNLCENFECWAKFVIDHDHTGRILYSYELTKDTEVILGKKYYELSGLNDINIDKNYRFADLTNIISPEGLYYERNYSKFICFKKFIGQENNIGFRYGINLKSIKRNIDSNQIVTKLIVESNSNEFAKDGFCTIQNSSLNSLGESIVYNFDYYIKKGLLSKNNLYYDLYETDNNAIGYFTKTEQINKELQPKIEEISNLSYEMERYASLSQSYQVTINEAEQKKQEQVKNIASAIGITIVEAQTVKESLGYSSVVNDFIKQRDLYDSIIQNSSKHLDYNQDLYLKAEQRYKTLQKEMLEAKKQKLGLEREFYKKYSRYIQEGTWISEDYYDEDLYYLDALGVSHTSAFPQISYTIDVLELSQVEGYENYSFKIGDKTYIEDTDFFGWVEKTGRPYQEEIVVSEIKYHLDDPSQNLIKVQNYKTQFEDLFQRIAATTQSLQYASGSFERATDILNSDGTINSSLLKDSLYNNALVLQNAKDQSVTWDETGITVTSLTSPSEIVRLVSGGIMLSNDGGRNWTTGITGNGINASVITTGRLDTNRIRIFNENEQTFEWNSTGLNAYGFNSNGLTNYGKFVRFDKWGIYAYDGGDPNFVPKTLSEVINNSTFSLTRQGFYLNANDGADKLTINSVDHIKIESNGYNLRMGLLGIDGDNNLRRVIDANNKFVVYEDGSLKAVNGNFEGKVDVAELLINGKVAMTNDKINGTFLNLNGVVVRSGNNVIFAVNSAGYKGVYINGKVEMASGSTINWANVNETNIEVSQSYIKASDVETKHNKVVAALGGTQNIKSTYISGTEIRSPTIKAASIYSSTLYSGDELTYVEIGRGGYEYRIDDGLPLIDLGFYPATNGWKLPFLAMGQGSSRYQDRDRGLIKKFGSESPARAGVWIGDSTPIDLDYPAGTGFYIDFLKDQMMLYFNMNGKQYSSEIINLMYAVAEQAIANNSSSSSPESTT